MADTILIIDFGSQLTQVARRLRKLVSTPNSPCTSAPKNIVAASPRA